MAQPKPGASAPRSQPWSPRPDRSRASAAASVPTETAGETTAQIPVTGSTATDPANPAVTDETTAPSMPPSAAGSRDGDFSPPRFSRASSLAAPPMSPAASAVSTGPVTTGPIGYEAESQTQTIPRFGTPTTSVPSAPSAPAGSPAGSAAAGSASAAASSPRRRPSGPRRARLQVRHISPWSVLKFTSLLAVALFLVWLIIVGLLYGVLDGSGVIGKINDTYTTISGAGTAPPVSTGLIFSGALVAGAVGAVVFVALSTVGSIIYNLCADVVGGIELTLAERD